VTSCVSTRFKRAQPPTSHVSATTTDATESNQLRARGPTSLATPAVRRPTQESAPTADPPEDMARMAHPAGIDGDRNCHDHLTSRPASPCLPKRKPKNERQKFDISLELHDLKISLAFLWHPAVIDGKLIERFVECSRCRESGDRAVRGALQPYVERMQDLADHVSVSKTTVRRIARLHSPPSRDRTGRQESRREERVDSRPGASFKPSVGLSS
jgi:hypothetical protein